MPFLASLSSSLRALRSPERARTGTGLRAHHSQLQRPRGGASASGRGAPGLGLLSGARRGHRGVQLVGVRGPAAALSAGRQQTLRRGRPRSPREHPPRCARVRRRRESARAGRDKPFVAWGWDADAEGAAGGQVRPRNDGDGEAGGRAGTALRDGDGSVVGLGAAGDGPVRQGVLPAGRHLVLPACGRGADSADWRPLAAETVLVGLVHGRRVRV